MNPTVFEAARAAGCTRAEAELLAHYVETDSLKAAASHARMSYSSARVHSKRLKESIEAARGAAREDLATQAERELAIAQVYLPAEVSDEKLAQIVADAVAKAGVAPGDARQVGPVMKLVMEQVKGQADGRRVQEAVKKALGL